MTKARISSILFYLLTLSLCSAAVLFRKAHTPQHARGPASVKPTAPASP